MTARDPGARAAEASPGRARGAGSSLRPRAVLLWLAAVVVMGLLLFTYRYLAVVVAGNRENPLAPLIDEMTGAASFGTLFLAVLWLVRRRPLRRETWLRRLPLYAAALLSFGGVCTSMMWGLREVLYPLAGLGDFDYGAMPLRYLMELPVQVLGFVAMVVGIHAVDALRAARERELRALQLETSLARAELRNLRLQLQPHFLFNALNTISSTMYRDPGAADEMLEQLAELLRASLRTAKTDEVPLATELELLDRYLVLLGARFGDRLRVSREVDPDAESALVPSMLLQPLVENAVRHGNASRVGRGAVELRARRSGDRLILEVLDDGPGVAEGEDPLRAGVGLSATAERLQLLYGASQRFEIGNGEGGGFVVRASIPFHTAPGAAA